jgi:hypothetical protein
MALIIIFFCMAGPDSSAGSNSEDYSKVKAVYQIWYRLGNDVVCNVAEALVSEHPPFAAT